MSDLALRSAHYLRLTFVDLAQPCARCGRIVPPGTTLRVVVDGQRSDVLYGYHDPECPPRWQPQLIEGGGRTTPRQLPLLATVDEESP